MTRLAKSGFLMVSGVVLFGTSVWFALSHLDLYRNGRRADGVVIDLSVHHVRGTDLYHPVVEFRGDDGKSATFTERTGLWSSLFEIGERVVVLYEPGATDEAKIDSFWMLWFLPLLTSLFAVACVIAAVSVFRGP